MDSVQKHIDAKWGSLEFFLARLESLFSDINIDELYDAFCDYETRTHEDIGHNAWNEAKVIDDI